MLDTMSILIYPQPYQFTNHINVAASKFTSQSMRDHERMRHRINKLGDKYNMVISHLESIYGPKLTCLVLQTQAAHFAEKLNINIDCLARRYRQGILCWFTENWHNILPLLPGGHEKNEKPNSPAPCEFIDVSDFRMLLNYH